MDLNVELNIVHFPLEEHEMCRIGDKTLREEKEHVFHTERRTEVLTQKAEIHLIKIGPVTELFLSRKKLNPALDFLPGVEFQLTEDNDYLWTSGSDLKGLPINCQNQLLTAIMKMGYTVNDYDDRVPHHTDQSHDRPVTKHIYRFNRKF